MDVSRETKRGSGEMFHVKHGDEEQEEMFYVTDQGVPPLGM